jgi:hypothetical protein
VSHHHAPSITRFIAGYFRPLKAAATFWCQDVPVMAQLAEHASSDQALRVVIAVLHAERFADVTDRYLPRAELAEDRYRLLVRRFGHDQHDVGAAILAQAFRRG